MVVNAGNSLILDCLSAGTPLPTISWFKDGVSSSVLGCVKLCRVALVGSCRISCVRLSHVSAVLCLLYQIVLSMCVKLCQVVLAVSCCISYVRWLCQAVSAVSSCVRCVMLYHLCVNCIRKL